MSKHAKGFLLAVAGLLAVVLIIAVAVVLSRGVEKGTIVEITIEGPIVEERDESIHGRLFQGDVTLVSELRTVFDKAARDEHVNGVMVVVKPSSMGYAKAQEIRAAAAALREAGKWAVAYLDTAGEFAPGNGMYFLASAFDEITVNPAGDVMLAGVYTASPFLRGLLDNIKIYPDFDHIGKYKNAKELYTEKGFTPAHREATEAWVGDLFLGLVEGIAESRKKSVDEVRSIIDRGPFTAQEALEAGLVDRVGYYDEFRDAVKERNGGKLRTLKWREYLKRRRSLGVGSHKIAVVHGTGIVLMGKSGYEPSAGFVMGSDSVAGALRKAREDSSVKAIILRVDSPGGSAVASDIIWRETQLARKVKPVIASMSDVAASGGYYVSCGADRIVAEPSTLTGSIGVVYGKFVLKGLYDWLGLTFGEVQRGEHAAFWNELRPWNSDEKSGIYWKFMNKVYSQFVSHVAEGRKMTPEDVDKIGQGRVWTGRRAKDLGLVDELGGFETAIRLAKEMAKIPQDEDVRFVDLPEKPTLWQSLWGGEGDEVTTELPRSARLIAGALQPLGRAALLDGQIALLMTDDVPDGR